MSALTGSCPKCGYRLRWIERVRTAKCCGLVRKVVSCPECGARICWSRRPWRLVIGCILVSLSLLPVGAVMGLDQSLEPEAIAWGVACLLPLFVALVAAFGMRLELAGSANHDT